MRGKSYQISAVIAVAMFTLSCTDVITITTEPVDERLVVDAWINNLEAPQTIRLTRSQPYFDQGFAPGVDEAEVIVTDDQGAAFVFSNQGAGDYVWQPQPGQTLGEVGRTYTLQIEVDGREYQAESEMRRVPAVDSIITEFRENELGFPDGMYAEMFARDFIGSGDTYWIKTYKNGEYLNKGFELNIAYDAGFDPGSRVDGVIFIPPIRELVNRVPDPDTEDNSDVPPYEIGDSVRVEIHSITQEAFGFLEIARDQMNNGANTIFAIPLANARSNVRNAQTGDLALGFFNVAAVTTRETVVE